MTCCVDAEKSTEEKRKYRYKKVSTEENREKLFKESIKFGRIFPCVCCHRLLFKNSVSNFVVSDFHEEIIRKVNCDEIIDQDLYICTTCKNYMSKKSVPPMCHTNSLQLFDISSYKELHLTELENSMIALNIVFQKHKISTGML